MRVYGVTTSIAVDDVTISLKFTPITPGFHPLTVPITATVVGKLIKLDPGHGGRFPGAIYPDPTRNEQPDLDEAGNPLPVLREKDITLKIALKLKKLLEEEGIKPPNGKVLMTRETDIHLDEDRDKDLKKRAQQTKNERPHLFLSIHINAADPKDTPDYTSVIGTETFVYPSEKPKELTLFEKLSKDFANKVQEKVHGVVKERDRNEVFWGEKGKPKEKKLTVLKYTLNGNTVGCLSEITFITNKESRKKLRDDKFLDEVAKALKRAIIETCSLTK